MSKDVIARIGLTGGADGDLDAYPVTSCETGKGAIVFNRTNGIYHYIYDESESGSESSPDIIIPDDNTSGTGAWVLEEINSDAIGTGKTIGDIPQYEDDGSANPVINHPNMPQVSGNPIVESGSNTDGKWTRWADGTQICMSKQTLSYVNSVTMSTTWSYPKAFSDMQGVYGTLDNYAGTNAHITYLGGNEPDTSSSPLRAWSTNGAFSSGETIDAYFQAIGRWF